jgi:hypothetical protein
LDTLEPQTVAASAPQTAALQRRIDPLSVSCSCGWSGTKQQLIPVQAALRRLCPECLTDLPDR